MSAVLKSTPARFLDQIAIITGASRGIGRGIAVAFAREGADIVLNYASNHAAAEEVASEIRALGRRCVLVAGSVGDPAVAETLAQRALGWHPTTNFSMGVHLAVEHLRKQRTAGNLVETTQAAPVPHLVGAS